MRWCGRSRRNWPRRAHPSTAGKTTRNWRPTPRDRTGSRDRGAGRAGGRPHGAGRDAAVHHLHLRGAGTGGADGLGVLPHAVRRRDAARLGGTHTALGAGRLARRGAGPAAGAGRLAGSDLLASLDPLGGAWRGHAADQLPGIPDGAGRLVGLPRAARTLVRARAGGGARRPVAAGRGALVADGAGDATAAGFAGGAVAAVAAGAGLRTGRAAVQAADGYGRLVGPGAGAGRYPARNPPRHPRKVGRWTSYRPPSTRTTDARSAST